MQRVAKWQGVFEVWPVLRNDAFNFVLLRDRCSVARNGFGDSQFFAEGPDRDGIEKMRRRSCTDLSCAVLFLLALVGMGYLASSAQRFPALRCECALLSANMHISKRTFIFSRRKCIRCLVQNFSALPPRALRDGLPGQVRAGFSQNRSIT